MILTFTILEKTASEFIYVQELIYHSIYIHTYTHTYCTYIHKYIHTYIHTHIHTYIHTSYIHTYIQSYYIYKELKWAKITFSVIHDHGKSTQIISIRNWNEQRLHSQLFMIITNSPILGIEMSKDYTFSYSWS